jgi:phenylalanyl-tRNA synthetase beta chain
MLVSYRWLSTFCTLPDVKTLVSDFDRIGFEVESVTIKGDDLSNIVIGHIQQMDVHPNAERLRVAQVDVGEKTVQIVTAATNVNTGDKIPVSLPGATLANGLNITESELRGEASFGMMCSAVECGLTDTSPGVWVLPPNVPVGTDFIEYAQLKDTVLDIAILPNRGDCLSLYGLARECAALYNVPITFKPTEPTWHAEDTPVTCTLNPDVCSVYYAQKITGIQHQHTPVVDQVRLYLSGERPINWIVDLTNLVMLETGHPMHAFDANGVSNITVTYGANQSVTLLNDKEVKVNENVPVVQLNQGVGAVAGIMGTDVQKVADTTTDIILEMAVFNPVVVRQASKALGVRSESSHRFEKQVDAASIPMALHRVHQVLSNHDTVTAYRPTIQGTVSDGAPKRMPVDFNQIRDFLGIDTSTDQMTEILSALGFGVENDTVQVPSWRQQDCTQWPDIAEEVCRFQGIDAIKGQPMSDSVQVAHDTQYMFKQSVLQTAVGLGFVHIIPFPLSSDDPNPNQPRVQNPITPELAVLRSNGIGTILQTAQYNAARHSTPNRLVSVAPVWTEDGDEATQLSILIEGAMQFQPFRRLESHTTAVDYYGLKGVFEQCFPALVGAYTVERSKRSQLHPGQSADIYVNDCYVGCMGMVHPTVLDSHKLGAGIGVIDINITDLADAYPNVLYYAPVSKYPATTRDVTYITSRSVAVGSIIDILNKNKPDLCTHIAVCGYFEQEGSDDVNVSFRMVYQDPEASLEMEAVNAVHKTFAETVIEHIPCRFP